MVPHVTLKLTFDSNPPADGLGVTEVWPHTTVTRTNPDFQPSQDSNPLHEEGGGYCNVVSYICNNNINGPIKSFTRGATAVWSCIL